MPDVSVLLAPRDEALGDRIASALSRSGHDARVYYGGREEGDLDDGDDPAIVVWSNAAIRLARLHEQARAALERGALVPVAIGGAAAPEGFENATAVDLSGWSGDDGDPRWRRILDELSLAADGVRAPVEETWRGAQTNAAALNLTTPAHLLSQDSAASGTRRRFDPAALGVAGVMSLSLLAGGAIIFTPDPSERPADAGPPTVGSLAMAQPIGPAPMGAPSMAARAEETAAQSSGVVMVGEPEVLTRGLIRRVSDIRTRPTPAPKQQIFYLPSSDPAPATSPANADGASEAPSLVETAPVPADPSLKAAPDNLGALVAMATAGPAPEETAPALAQESVEHAGDFFRDCLACPDMRALRPSAFKMGAPAGEPVRQAAEGPVVNVEFAQVFAIATREVTFAQWEACVAEGGCRAYAPPDHGWGRGEQPVVSISFDDASAYAAWLSEKTGARYRLPSEAEWEFAARAGSSAPFAFGANLTVRDANYDGRFPYTGEAAASPGRPAKTASYPANGFGLFDMHGNVWEWTADCWSASHAGAPTDGTPRGGACAERVLKGGAFNTGGWRLRSAHRIGKSAGARESDIGFRVVREMH